MTAHATAERRRRVEAPTLTLGTCDPARVAGAMAPYRTLDDRVTAALDRMRRAKATYDARHETFAARVRNPATLDALRDAIALAMEPAS